MGSIIKRVRAVKQDILGLNRCNVAADYFSIGELVSDLDRPNTTPTANIKDATLSVRRCIQNLLEGPDPDLVALDNIHHLMEVLLALDGMGPMSISSKSCLAEGNTNSDLVVVARKLVHGLYGIEHPAMDLAEHGGAEIVRERVCVTLLVVFHDGVSRCIRRDEPAAAVLNRIRGAKIQMRETAGSLAGPHGQLRGRVRVVGPLAPPPQTSGASHYISQAQIEKHRSGCWV